MRCRDSQVGWRPVRSLGCAAVAVVLLYTPTAALATVFDWDNWSGDGSFQTRTNWNPYPDPPNVPGAGDTAVFDGVLAGSGIGNNTVDVADGTAILDMSVIDTAFVNLTIGDGTTGSRFDLDQTTGNSLVVGDSSGDMATLNLLGGWLDTYDTWIGGRAVFNVIGEGSYWDSTSVLISGDTVTETAAIGLAQHAQIMTSGSLDIGSDTGSGRVVVDSQGLGPTTSWTVTGSVDVGPSSTSGFNFGQLTLQQGGRMQVYTLNVHGADVTSTVTVKSGGDMHVSGLLQIGPYGNLELFDASSTITTGDIDNDGGTLNWTGGTLHIAEGTLLIDDSADADLEIASLTVGSGMTLQATSTSSDPPGLRIGGTGTGSLSIQGGGVVESFHASIGDSTGSHGTCTVNGGGSRLDAMEDLFVGYFGNAVGRLDIQAAGHAEANSVLIGRANTADGIVVVDGSGSTLTSTAVLAVGGFIDDTGVTSVAAGGTGSLTVQNGASVDVYRTLIVFSDSSLAVSGTSELIANHLRLEPGASFSDAAGTTVRVNQLTGFGHATFNGNLQIGHAAGVGGSGSHTVGAGESLNVQRYLTVGYDARGTLDITDGGTVVSCWSSIAGLAGSGGSSVSVNGAGSRWDILDALYVGGSSGGPGGAGLLAVENNGWVDIGDSLKIFGGSGVHVGGATSSGTVTVGDTLRIEPGGTLEVETGGNLYADSIDFSGGGDLVTTGANSTVYVNAVSGLGSTWTINGNLGIGWPGGGGAGALALGSGQTLGVTSVLYLGENAPGTLTVGPGALAEIRQVRIATGGGTGSLDVTGGNMEVFDLLQIGPGGTLQLLSPASTTITGDIDNNGGTFTWTGGTLHITDGRLRIDDSTFADLDLASLTIGSGMTLKITATQANPPGLSVGNIGTGELSIYDGGGVESYCAAIGEGAGSHGTCTVNGGASRLDVTEDLHVGYTYNAIGRLEIQAGGHAEGNSISLGESASADGTVVVDGPNSTLTSTAVLAVGGIIGDDGVTGAAAGGTGQLTVQDGASVDVYRTLIVFGGSSLALSAGVGGSGTTVVANHLWLEPGASFSDMSGCVIRVNQLTGFGDHPAFNGNLQIGHAAGISGQGSHAVGAGQSLDVGAALVVGKDAQGELIITDGGTVESGRSFIAGEGGSWGSFVLVDGPASRWDIWGDLYIGGDTFGPQDLGSLTIQNGGTVSAAWGVLAWGSGRVFLDQGTLVADTTSFALRLAGGQLIGRGTIEGNVSSDGLVIPDDPSGNIGHLAITGDYTQGDGALLIDIGGATPDKYDQLLIGGAATLDGVLEVLLVGLEGGPTYEPVAGDAFTLLDCDGGISGCFDSMNLPSLAEHLRWNTDALCTSGVLSVTWLTLPGDANLDGYVNELDAQTLAGHWGQAGGWTEGDFDDDGVVGPRDASIMAAHWGYGTSESTAVPEPGVLVTLLGMAWLTLLWRRQRKL